MGACLQNCWAFTNWTPAELHYEFGSVRPSARKISELIISFFYFLYEVTQLTFLCLKSIIEALEKGVKYVQR